MANTSKIGGKIEEKRRAFRMEMVGWHLTCFDWLRRFGDRTASRRTALRCRSAPPVRDFGLEEQAGF